MDRYWPLRHLCVPQDESSCLRGSFLPYPAGERPWPNMPHRAFQVSKYRPCGAAWQEDFTFRPSCAIDGCPVRRLKSSEGQLASGFPPGTDAEGLYEVLSPYVEEAPPPFTAVAAYSPRNPLMGSSAAARRAGRKLASNVTAPRMSVTTAYTRRSPGSTPNSTGEMAWAAA